MEAQAHSPDSNDRKNDLAERGHTTAVGTHEARARSLWAALPENVTLIVQEPSEELHQELSILGAYFLNSDNEIAMVIQNLMAGWGKQVSFKSIPPVPKDKSGRLKVDVDGATLKLHANDQTIMTQPRFDDSLVYLAVTGNAYGRDQNRVEVDGLIGSKSSGLIRNFYILGHDGSIDSNLELHVRAHANQSGKDQTKGALDTFLAIDYSERSFPVLFEYVLERLKKVAGYDRVLVVNEHFNDHLRPELFNLIGAVESLKRHFPEAVHETITIADGAGRNYSYDKYPTFLPEVKQIAQHYQSEEKVLFVYDRHAWGIFNLCSRGGLKEGIWYNHPRSTETKTLLQLPEENLIGSLASYTSTEEAQAMFAAAGLSNPFTAAEVREFASELLEGVAQKWISEREPD